MEPFLLEIKLSNSQSVGEGWLLAREYNEPRGKIRVFAEILRLIRGKCAPTIFIHEFTRTSTLWFPNVVSNFEVIITYVGSWCAPLFRCRLNTDWKPSWQLLYKELRSNDFFLFNNHFFTHKIWAFKGNSIKQVSTESSFSSKKTHDKKHNNPNSKILSSLYHILLH